MSFGNNQKPALSPWQRCRDLKQTVDARIEPSDFNRMMCWKKDETIDHWSIKCLIFKILREMGRTVVGEANMGGGYCDVIDLDTGYIYEVETNPTPQTTKDKILRYNSAFITDIIIIPIKELPKGDKERYKELKSKWIV